MIISRALGRLYCLQWLADMSPSYLAKDLKSRAGSPFVPIDDIEGSCHRSGLLSPPPPPGFPREAGKVVWEMLGRQILGVGLLWMARLAASFSPFVLRLEKSRRERSYKRLGDLLLRVAVNKKGPSKLDGELVLPSNLK